MLYRTAVKGGYYENGSAIFILYACVPKGNHVVFNYETQGRPFGLRYPC